MDNIRVEFTPEQSKDLLTALDTYVHVTRRRIEHVRNKHSDGRDGDLKSVQEEHSRIYRLYRHMQTCYLFAEGPPNDE